MTNVLIIVSAAVLLTGLLYFEKRENRKGLLPFKTVLSALFILAVLLQGHPVPGYYYLLLAGLILCFCGDIFLALPREKMFFFGLIAFLLGHVGYLLAFYYVSQPSLPACAGTLAILIISSIIYRRLLPHLGQMKTPVLFYVIVITIMASGAWSVLFASNLYRPGRIMVFAGALSFYFSDVFVARDRFLKKEFLNRLIGLPLYYGGQFLLAFSVSLLFHVP